MMTLPELEAAIQPLVEEYDPKLKHYGPERVRAIWETCKAKGLSFDMVRRVVRECFYSERSAPMARDIERIADRLTAEDKARLELEERRRARDEEFNAELPPEEKARRLAAQTETLEVVSSLPPAPEIA